MVAMESKADSEDWYTEPERGLDEALRVVDGKDSDTFSLVLAFAAFVSATFLRKTCNIPTDSETDYKYSMSKGWN